MENKINVTTLEDTRDMYVEGLRDTDIDFSAKDYEPYFRMIFGRLQVKKVIANPPATIVLWDDGTKTVVKCQDGDEYDKLTGALLCVAKKAFGRNYTILKKKLFQDVVERENTPDKELKYLAKRLLRLAEKEQRTIYLSATKYRFRPEDFYDAEATVYYSEPKGTGSGEIVSAYLKDMDGILDKAKKLERLEMEKVKEGEI